jgi:hypothetical protein
MKKSNHILDNKMTYIEHISLIDENIWSLSKDVKISIIDDLKKMKTNISKKTPKIKYAIY